MMMVDRGVEYHVEFNENFEKHQDYNDIWDISAECCLKLQRYLSYNSKLIIIASSTQTDDRLLKSSYFKERENNWFDSNFPRKNYIETELIDLSLSEKEQRYLDFVLEKFGKHIVKHGWVDIIQIK
jgi:hypothetical protein